MIAKRERDYFIFKYFKDIFDGELSKDFSTKMMQHLNVKEKIDPDKLGTLTDTILPYVNGKLCKHVS